MKTFSIIFAMAVIAFGNCFFILALMDHDYDKCNDPAIFNDPVQAPLCEKFVGNDLLTAIVYSFRMGLGDFQVDSYDKKVNGALLWIVFISAVIIMQIILLNMLIAIMGETFKSVTE